MFGTVAEAIKETGADVSIAFVPPAFAKDAIIEAIDAEIPLLVVITEGIPVQDTAYAWAYNVEKGNKTRIIGPNCPGIITPGESLVGITPANITGKGPIGLVSKSGTLTYQMMYELRDFGFSTAIGIGGDPVIGTTHIDAIEAFEKDPETKVIVMIGEIGGDAEERAAAYIKANVTKPVVGYVAGFTAPEGKTMGHAGAIVSGSLGHRPGQEGSAGGCGREGRQDAVRDRRAGSRDPAEPDRPGLGAPRPCAFLVAPATKKAHGSSGIDPHLPGRIECPRPRRDGSDQIGQFRRVPRREGEDRGFPVSRVHHDDAPPTQLRLDTSRLGVADGEGVQVAQFPSHERCGIDCRGHRARVGAHQSARPQLDSPEIPCHDHRDVDEITGLEYLQHRYARGATGFAVVARTLDPVAGPVSDDVRRTVMSRIGIRAPLILDESLRRLCVLDAPQGGDET